MLGALACVPLIGNSQEGDFPTRPVELVVNFGPGGSADQAGRSVSRFLPDHLGVPVPVNNVTGASGNTGLTGVASAEPDGYTIGTFTGIAVTTMATGVSRLKMDQFEFLAIADAGTSMFFVGEKSPFQDFQGLLDYAKENPGKVRVATAGFGTQDDIAVKAISKAGYELVNVPMDPGERHMAPVGGHAEVLFQQVDAVVSLVQSGDLKPIVVFANERHSAFPDVPIAKEFGLELNLPNWRGLVAPAGTPEDRVKVLHDAIRNVLESAEYKEICERQYKCVEPMDPDGVNHYARDYYEQITGLMEQLGLGQ
jgi:tripartite-type tricarboxylate transporter receptor subunit TctC